MGSSVYERLHGIYCTTLENEDKMLDYWSIIDAKKNQLLRAEVGTYWSSGT